MADAAGLTLRKIVAGFRAIRESFRLPRAALEEQRRDRRGRAPDPGPALAVAETMAWLERAQDATPDGGVAALFSLVNGWSSSYPETTGYIVPTVLECGRRLGRPELRERARRMLDWLVSIQLPDGAFQGGLIDSRPVLPSTFNTGQILIGLAAGVREFGETYRASLRRAGDWLVETQDPDGSWRRHPSAFAMAGDRAYDTHVALGLIEAARVEPGRGYTEAAVANVRWAMGLQRNNGWLDRCCLTDATLPLTHTIGYALRGMLEGYHVTQDRSILDACRATADGLLSTLGPDGLLPGRIASDWRGASGWACLTGCAQVAACWLLLYHWTREERYRDAAFDVIRFIRCTLRLDREPETRGGIAGSFPIDGEYRRFEFLNWAAKFFIDAQFLALDAASGGELPRDYESAPGP